MEVTNQNDCPYQNSVIYKLLCNDSYFYISSTTSTLKNRKCNHITESKKYPEKTVYKHINDIGWENVKIEVILKYPCKSKKELNDKENELIQKEKGNELCLNFESMKKNGKNEVKNENLIEKTGYVYKIECYDNYYYIGSTIDNLNHRLYEHKRCSKKNPERPLYKHINQIGWNYVKIVLLDTIKFKSRDELYKIEDKYIKECIDDKYCLNNNVVERTEEYAKEYQKKYVKENEEHIKDYRKSYNKINSERRSAYTKEYVKQHPEETKEAKKLYYEKNKEEITKKNMEYVEKNKEIVAERKRKWAEKNKERLKEEAKKKRDEKKEEIKERGKKYYEQKKEEILRKNKEYYEKNKEKINEQIKEYREKNKEKYSKQSVCECGGTYTRTREKRHKESKKHQNWEEKNESASSLKG
jgi:hypothetical protein